MGSGLSAQNNARPTLSVQTRAAKENKNSETDLVLCTDGTRLETAERPGERHSERPEERFKGESFKVFVPERHLLLANKLSKFSSSRGNEPSCAMGLDPSSKYFCTRYKAIRYVTWMKMSSSKDLAWPLSISANYFIQSAKYNDFSGGYKRSYSIIPDEIILDEDMQTLICEFAEAARLPDGALLLIQIQTTVPTDNTPRDVTGQGIHTDGTDSAAMLIISRKNVNGAVSGIYADLDGKQPLMKKQLEPGATIFWRDNSIFHDVSDICLKDASKPGERTVMIIHTDARCLLCGNSNSNNSLGTNAASRQLRLCNSTK